MSSLADRTLTGEALARRLHDFRSVIVRKHHNLHRNQLSFEDVDDLYGRAVLVLLEKDPPAVFPNDRALRAWLEETMRRSILKYAQSAAGRATQTAASIDELGVAPTAADNFKWSVRKGVAAAQLASSDFTPEQRALLGVEQDTIEEYIAGLSETDQRIALLYLWPSSRMPARKIAAVLELPVSEVQLATQRIAMSWQRYTAMSVGNVCRRQMKHLERWQHDGGRMPLQLLIHARRCSNCRQTILAARRRGYDALLPLIPAAGLSGTAAGVLAKLASAAMLAVRKVMRVIGKLIPAGKEGAGSALLAGKGAATAAIVVTATAGVATVGTVVAVRAGAPHAADHARRPRVAAAAVAPPRSAPLTGSRQPAAVTRSTSTTAVVSSPVAASPAGAAGGASDRRPGAVVSSSASTGAGSHTPTRARAITTSSTSTSTTLSDSSGASQRVVTFSDSGGQRSPTGATAATP